MFLDTSDLHLEDIYLRLDKKAEAGMAFAHRWHDPNKVAAITKKAYEE